MLQVTDIKNVIGILAGFGLSFAFYFMNEQSRIISHNANYWFAFFIFFGWAYLIVKNEEKVQQKNGVEKNGKRHRRSSANA